MTTILLDVDTKQLGVLQNISQRAGFVNAFLGLGLRLEETAETNRGYHLYFRTSVALTGIEVVALQAMLGSDWKREVFNYRHNKNKVRKWNVLFRDTELKNCAALKFMLQKLIEFHEAWQQFMKIEIKPSGDEKNGKEKTGS